MPKVSEEYRDARRRHILAAARTCFARDGFHQTSMQDLFAEAELSSGAVYGYFPGKSAMIVAIARENVSGFVSMLNDATEHPDGRALGCLIGDILEAIRTKHQDRCMGGIALTTWAEAVRDCEISDALAASLAPVRAGLVAVAEQYDAAGRLPAHVTPDAIANTVLTLVPGFIVQLTLYGEASVAGVPDTMRALLP